MKKRTDNSKKGLVSADDATKQNVPQQGGNAVNQDPQHMSDIGHNGGKVAQQSENAHQITQE